MDRTERREAAKNLAAVIILEAALLTVIALVLWPLRHASLALTLAAGFGLFFLLAAAAAQLLGWAQDAARVNLYDHADAYVLSNLAVSAVLVAAWSAFGALAVSRAAAGAPGWTAAVLHCIGLLSCWMAFTVVGAFFTGTIYRSFNLPFAAATYALFACWPAAARFLFGWVFDLP